MILPAYTVREETTWDGSCAGSPATDSGGSVTGLGEVGSLARSEVGSQDDHVKYERAQALQFFEGKILIGGVDLHHPRS